MSNSQDMDLHELQKTTNAARENLKKEKARQKEVNLHRIIDEIKSKIWNAAEKGEDTVSVYDMT